MAFRDVLTSSIGYNSRMSQSATPPHTTARRFHWRRLFQFRLRTLLILTTIIAVVLGWWSYRASHQRHVVAEARRMGLIVRYDLGYWIYDDKGVIDEFDEDIEERQKKNSLWPIWLIDSLGIDYFANVKGVYVPFDTRISDADLARLQKSLPNYKIQRQPYGTMQHIP